MEWIQFSPLESCSMTSNALLTGFLFRQIFVLFFFCIKGYFDRPCQANNQTIERGHPYNFNFSTLRFMIKIFQGGSGVVTPSKPLLHYEQLLPLSTPCFKMFLERSLKDPPLQASFTATPSPSTTPSSLKIPYLWRVIRDNVNNCKVMILIVR